MEQHINVIVSHLNNYVYELRKDGKALYAESVGRDCQAAIAGIQKLFVEASAPKENGND